MFLKQIMADALVVIKLLTVIYRVLPVLHFSVSKDCNDIRGTQREYSSKPLKHSIVKRILVFKR